MRWISSVAIACILISAMCVHASPRCSQLSVQVTNLDSAIKQYMWASRTTLYVLTTKGTVYVSEDGGYIWSTLNFGEGAKIEHIVDDVSSEEAFAYFIGTAQYSWVRNETYEQPSQGIYPIHIEDSNIVQIKTHKAKPGWSLVRSRSSACETNVLSGGCEDQLWLTKDWGTTWTLIAENIASFEWGAYPNTILWLQRKSGSALGEHQACDTDFYRSSDLGVHKTVTENVSRLQTTPKGHVYYAKELHCDAPFSLVSLYVSFNDGTSFERAEFPSIISEWGYEITNDDQGIVFVAVDEGGKVTLYHAEQSSGSLSFTMSLNHLLPSPSSNGMAFQPLLGVDGLFIANHYAVQEWEWEGMTKEEKNTIDEFTRTKITYNKGAIWNELVKPTNEDLCADCILRLYLSNQNKFDSVLTGKTAAGLIIANGRYAPAGSMFSFETDSQKVSTYISRDGGNSWTRVAEQASQFILDDHGVFITLVADDMITNKFSFTLDEGMSWQTCNLTSEYRKDGQPKSMFVQEVLGDRDQEGTRVIVFGQIPTEETGTQEEQWIISSWDYKDLGLRYCAGKTTPDVGTSDYEYYTPEDPNSGTCLLGVHRRITRKKQTSLCYNELDYEPVEFDRPCSCTREDYMCDGKCFERQEISQSCVNICTQREDDPWKEPKDCDTSWDKSQGFKKIAGDSCDENGAGALNLSPIPAECQHPYPPSTTTTPTPTPTPKGEKCPEPTPCACPTPDPILACAPCPSPAPCPPTPSQCPTTARSVPNSSHVSVFVLLLVAVASSILTACILGISVWVLRNRLFARNDGYTTTPFQNNSLLEDDDL